MESRKRKRYDECYFDIEEDILYRLNPKKEIKNRKNIFLNFNNHILLKLISKHGEMTLKDFIPMMQTSKLSYSIFKPLFSSGAALLQKIAFGQKNEAEKMIKLNPKLMLEKNMVTDYSDRTFYRISPLQYSAWARDMDMLNMLIKYLSKEEQKAAFMQLDDLDRYGTEHGPSYDPKPLIDAMREINHNRLRWTIAQKKTYGAKIASLQYQVPVHVAKEYDRELEEQGLKFDSNRTFKENVPLPHSFDKTCWFQKDPRPIGKHVVHLAEVATALEMLFKVRGEQYNTIKLKLYEKYNEMRFYRN